MVSSSKAQCHLAVFLFSLLIVAPSALKANFIEIGDAGQTPATFQESNIVQGPLGLPTSIFGILSSSTDADVFRFTITNTSLFSASTRNSVTGSGSSGGLDTQLFLFNSAFQPIIANDDEASGATLQSLIPSGTSLLGSLTAGTYYIGISLSGNDPVNTANQLVFTTGLSTALRGRALGINPMSFSDFNSFTAFAESGAYRIDIASVAVPDSGSTLFLMLAALAGLFYAARASAKALEAQNSRP